MIDNPFDEMASKWPSTVVSRSSIRAFTGGLLSPGTMANLDSQGIGPSGRIKLGRNTGYPVRPLVEWLKSRSKTEVKSYKKPNQ